MRKIVAFSSPIFLLVLCLLIAASQRTSFVAYATGAPSLSGVTAVTSCEMGEDGVPVRTRGEIDPTQPVYRKDAEVTFFFGEYDARLFIRIGDEEEIEVTQLSVRTGDTVRYRVAASGIVTVIARAYSAGEKIGETSVVVYSDNDAPTPPAAPEMTEWLPLGREYVVRIDLLAFSDDLSGRGKAYYCKNDEALTEIADLDADALTFSVTEPTDFSLLFLDAAGNLRILDFSCDKYDSTRPPAPVITVTSNAPGSTYARYYTLEIDYPTDGESGLQTEQYYSVNGIAAIYSGPVRLDQPKNYDVTAYARDNAGNTSEVSHVEVYGSTFDVTPPTVVNFSVEIDLKKEKICSVSVAVNDAESGVKRVSLQDGAGVFRPVTASTYVAEFDCYDLSELVFTATDVAGNDSFAQYPLPFFGTRANSDKLKYYAGKYRVADPDSFTEAAWERLVTAYDDLSFAAGSSVATQKEFDAAIAAVADAYEYVRSGYVVENATSYLSGMLEYTVNEDDFSAYKTGEDLKITFSPADCDDTLVAAAGFSSGFTDGFSLRITVGDSPLAAPLSQGIAIKLNLPVGYYERSFALYSGGNVVPSEIVNNKIEFTVKQDADYVLVVSGSRSVDTGTEEQKTVAVFGRRLSYGAFFGVVFGTIGGVILIVGGLIAFSLLSKRGRREG